MLLNAQRVISHEPFGARPIYSTSSTGTVTGAADVFVWSENQKGGSSLCHYVGHWKCVRFDRLTQPSNEDDKMIIKQKGRSALLEFVFVDFDDDLDCAMLRMETPAPKRK